MVQCLPIVVYINGSFIKNRIAVKPIYITVTVPNLSSAVSGKSFVWQVQGMLPVLKKKPTGSVERLARPAQTQIASCMHETCSGFRE